MSRCGRAFLQIIETADAVVVKTMGTAVKEQFDQDASNHECDRHHNE
jgi:hypothetical protein